MPSMPKFGIFIYAKSLDALSEYYQAVLGLALAHRTDQMVVLRSPEFQLIAHVMPPHVAAQVTIACPPDLRDNVAIKFFYTVQSLADAEVAARANGGQVFPEQWQGKGFVVRNASDPEGNIFQIRQSC